ncbi:hypothetical protein MTO96_047666 [Rhipicephalus appendiculatus]
MTQQAAGIARIFAFANESRRPRREDLADYATTTSKMVNSRVVVVNRMVVVAVVVMVVVSVVLPVVHGKGSKAGKAGKANKAGKGPGSAAGSFGTPPPPSEDCDGVEMAAGGGASLVADPNDCTKVLRVHGNVQPEAHLPTRTALQRGRQQVHGPGTGWMRPRSRDGGVCAAMGGSAEKASILVKYKP